MSHIRKSTRLSFLLQSFGSEESADKERGDGDGEEDGHDDPAGGVGHAVVHAEMSRIEILGPLFQHFLRQVLPEL